MLFRRRSSMKGETRVKCDGHCISYVEGWSAVGGMARLDPWRRAERRTAAACVPSAKNLAKSIIALVHVVIGQPRLRNRPLG